MAPEVVYYWIDCTVRHSQPVETKEDVPNVGGLHDVRVVVGVYEVDMVRQPADGKKGNHKTKHLDNVFLVPATPSNMLSCFSRHISEPKFPPHSEVAQCHDEERCHVGRNQNHDIITEKNNQALHKK